MSDTNFGIRYGGWGILTLMLFRTEFYQAIEQGKIRVAYRRWRRPSVKAGGTLKSPVGLLAIETVELFDPATLTEKDAKAAGYRDLHQLIKELNERDGGEFYRIRFHHAGADPRIALRESDDLDRDEAKTIRAKLERLDKASPEGAWTAEFLRVLQRYPDTRAADLAEMLFFDKLKLKINMRKLKEIGLVESRNPGYRLSPRGVAFLRSTGQPA
jgi:hypothetical protein